MKRVTVGLLLVAGCGRNVVNGEVSGEPVAIGSGYFAQEDDLFEGGDGQIAIVLSSLDDTCETQTSFFEAAEDADDASDFEDAAKEFLPDDFWVVELFIRVGDPGDSQENKVIDGVAWDELAEKDDQVVGYLTHYVDTLDEEYWTAVLEGGSVGDYEELFYTDGGDLEITKHKVDETLKGFFVTEAAATDDGDTEGAIEIHFSVDRCPAMEQYLFATE